MERRIRRHTGRSKRLEFLPKDRDDLLAKDVHLLQNDLERQTGVIGDEQLALIVADELAEAQRPVDDLLWAADPATAIRT